MNTKSKGNKHEKEMREIYSKAGFLVWSPGRSSRCIGPGKFISTPQDVFDAFDFIATSPIEIHWVQVKSNESHASEARTLIDTIPMPPGTIRVVVCRIKGKVGWFLAWVNRGAGWIRSETIENDLFEITPKDIGGGGHGC